MHGSRDRATVCFALEHEHGRHAEWPADAEAPSCGGKAAHWLPVAKRWTIDAKRQRPPVPAPPLVIPLLASRRRQPLPFFLCFSYYLFRPLIVPIS
jgi:hypothetical protein